MTQTKPTAGALRAAEAYCKWANIPEVRDHLAAIIDRESGLKELMEAAELAQAQLGDLVREGGSSDNDIEAYEAIKRAIAKVSNPNADVRQAFPAGRWSERATL